LWLTSNKDQAKNCSTSVAYMNRLYLGQVPNATLPHTS